MVTQKSDDEFEYPLTLITVGEGLYPELPQTLLGGDQKGLLLRPRSRNDHNEELYF
jgi:hypothetical protein